MTISERIFLKLEELNMSQKVFSEKTGISQSTISEWKSKKTNPSADKIMIICKVLSVSPEWLLSGIEKEGKRGNKPSFIVVDKKTETGEMLTTFNGLSRDKRERLLGYMYALMETQKMSEKSEKHKDDKM